MDPAWGDGLADPHDIDLNVAVRFPVPRRWRCLLAVAAGRGSRGFGDAMHEAFEVNNARDVKKSQATDVAAMELSLSQHICKFF